MRAPARHSRSARRGSVLFAVLVVVVLLSLAAYQYSDLMIQEYTAAQSALKATQARALADSGVYYAAAVLADDAVNKTLAGNVYDNEGALHDQDVMSSTSGGNAGRFSILSPVDASSGTTARGYRFGVVDESSKININALITSGVFDPQKIHDILMNLPNMT